MAQRGGEAVTHVVETMQGIHAESDRIFRPRNLHGRTHITVDPKKRDEKRLLGTLQVLFKDVLLHCRKNQIGIFPIFRRAALVMPVGVFLLLAASNIGYS